MLEPRASLHDAWPLSGGISSRMTVLEFVVGDERRRAILRQPDGALHENPLAVANEFKLLRWLKSTGLAVPAPLLAVDSHELFGAPFLVIEYIDGAPNFAPQIAPESIEQMAKQLLRIHRAPLSGQPESLPAYVPRFVHQRDSVYPDPSLRPTEIRDALSRAWLSRSTDAVGLLHGDYWPGNLLWNGGDLIGVVDWEEACMGDPLTDLAITRLDLLWAFGIEAMHAFTACYAALSSLDLHDLPLWDLDAALRPVFNLEEWAAASPNAGNADDSYARMRAGHQTFVHLAFDALSRRRG